MANVYNCYTCKGKRHCGLKFCPIMSRFSRFKVQEVIDFSGVSPPTVFIGSKLKYPEVNVGVLSPVEKVDNIEIYDNQLFWSRNNFNINQISGLRSSLVNSRVKARVSDARNLNKELGILQEIGMCLQPVDVEIKLRKKIKFSLRFDQINAPIGPAGNLKSINTGENIKIDTRIEKVYSDTDLKAKDALSYLGRNFNEQQLSQLLSVGVLGLGKNRKFVSTRNSITAVDDFLGREIIREIKNYDCISEHRMYYGNYLGNYYIVMMFPDVFNYELFEVYMKGSAWNPASENKVSHDFEDYYGRKNYAKSCSGGYYAARAGVLEELRKIKRQASILIIRFETPEYFASLGVWVVREACRKAMQKCEIFDSREKMISKAGKFGFNINEILKESWLLKKISTQKKIFEF